MSEYSFGAIWGGLAVFKQTAQQAGFAVKYYRDMAHDNRWRLIVPQELKDSQDPWMQYGLRELAKVDEITIEVESGVPRT